MFFCSKPEYSSFSRKMKTFLGCFDVFRVHWGHRVWPASIYIHLLFSHISLLARSILAAIHPESSPPGHKSSTHDVVRPLQYELVHPWKDIDCDIQGSVAKSQIGQTQAPPKRFICAFLSSPFSESYNLAPSATISSFSCQRWIGHRFFPSGRPGLVKAWQGESGCLEKAWQLDGEKEDFCGFRSTESKIQQLHGLLVFHV